MTLKLCINCAYYLPKKVCGISRPEYAKCAHPLARSPIDGQPNIYCAVMRWAVGDCGPNGRLFEAVRVVGADPFDQRAQVGDQPQGREI